MILQIKAKMTNTGARKKIPLLSGITPGGMTEQNLKLICDIGKDLSIAAIRGAQVTINLEEDFQNIGLFNNNKNSGIPVFIRSNQVRRNCMINITIVSDLKRRFICSRIFNAICFPFLEMCISHIDIRIFIG